MRWYFVLNSILMRNSTRVSITLRLSARSLDVRFISTFFVDQLQTVTMHLTRKENVHDLLDIHRYAIGKGCFFSLLIIARNSFFPQCVSSLTEKENKEEKKLGIVRIGVENDVIRLCSFSQEVAKVVF